MAKSAIEWTDSVWNPVSGCTRVSAGCDNCYAVKMTKRLEAMGQDKYSRLVNIGKGHFNGVVRCHEDALTIPLKARKPRRWFVNSMSDLFHKEVPFEFIDKVFAVMALCPHHTFQVLTKRPERMAEYFHYRPGMERAATIAEVAMEIGNIRWRVGGRIMFGFEEDRRVVDDPGWPLPNVWLGTSVEDQATADERIPHLLRCPAAVRFLSCEPLLGPVDFRHASLSSADIEAGVWRHVLTGQLFDEECNPLECLGGDRSKGIHWVIVGGESGPGARPMKLEWALNIVRQCKGADVPVFVKQLGACPTFSGQRFYPKSKKGGDIDNWPQELRVREFPGAGNGG